MSQATEVRVTTPLSAATAGDFDGLLDDAVELRPAHLIIDLTECEYLDATGIGLLLEVHRRVWRDGGRLSLRGLSSRLLRILQIARVDRVLQTATAPAACRPSRRRMAAATAAGISTDAADPSRRGADVEWWLWILMIVLTVAVMIGGLIRAQGRRRRGRVVVVRDVPTGGRR